MADKTEYSRILNSNTHCLFSQDNSCVLNYNFCNINHVFELFLVHYNFVGVNDLLSSTVIPLFLIGLLQLLVKSQFFNETLASNEGPILFMSLVYLDLVSCSILGYALGKAYNRI